MAAQLDLYIPGIGAKNLAFYRSSSIRLRSHLNLRPFTKQPTGREVALRITWHVAHYTTDDECVEDFLQALPICLIARN